MAATSTPRRRRGGTAGLDKAQIVEAALQVIDEHGVSGLTMRRLGTALGVDAMAVYWHLDGKAAVLDAVVEHQAARLGGLGPDGPDDPTELMVAIAQHLRRVLLEHPNLAPLLASRPLPQHEAPALIVFGAHLLRRAGFADEDIPRATEALSLFGLGYVLQEIGVAQRRAELGQSFSDQQEALRAQVEAQPGDTTLEQRMITHRLREGARDDDFEIALRAMLNGLRLGLGRPDPDSTATWR